MPEPPLCWQLRNGRKLLLFDYICIKLWELPREELLALNQPALLPLILLTKGTVDRILVKEMFQNLLENKLQDLCVAGEIFAAWFLQGDDLAWLKKELLMLTDLFKDSPAYHWMTDNAREEGLAQGLAQGLVKGREEERKVAHEEALEQFRQTILAIVAQRFPTLVRSAQRQIHFSQDMTHLQQLLINLSVVAQNTTDAEHYLLHFDDESIQLE
jgi:D-aminopeptidase